MFAGEERIALALPGLDALDTDFLDLNANLPSISKGSKRKKKIFKKLKRSIMQRSFNWDTCVTQGEQEKQIK